MKKILIAGFTAAAVLFTGCGEDEEKKVVHQPVVQEVVQPIQQPIQQPVQPQYVQAAPQPVIVHQDSGAGDMLMGAAVGMMVGNALADNGGGYDRGYDGPRGGTTVNKTVINKTYVNKIETPSTPSTFNHTTAKSTQATPSTKTVQTAPEKPAKASYRDSAAKKPQTAGAKAKYRQPVAKKSYQPTKKKSVYRPKKKVKSSWGGFKKSSFRKKR